jgi:acid phosphatase (class A)
MTSRQRILCLGLALGFVTIAAGHPKADDVLPTQQPHPGLPPGYLSQAARPDSMALLPPPPADGSAALAQDEQISRADLALQGAPRWRLAGMDANLSFPWAAGDFVCALGASIALRDTPHLYLLLRRTLADAELSARAAKDNYRRPRPFLANKAPTCTPGAEDRLAQEGSYPSAHATIGWIWALILSEISPEQAQAILARGQAFAQSRVICNVHWESDVIESRSLATAVVAELHVDPVFLADLDAAKSELAAVRAKKLAPQRDCRFEADALAQQLPQGP